MASQLLHASQSSAKVKKKAALKFIPFILNIFPIFAAHYFSNQPMNILLLGSGGREHAIAWKLVQSQPRPRLFIVPGNTGTQQLGTNLPVAVTDFEGIKKACVQHQIELLIVGPEEPLVKGIVAYLRQYGDLKKLLIV